jgi:methionine aminopeptidase
MIEILHQTELPRARKAGALVADILQTLQQRTAVGTNLLDIDRWARAMIVEAGAVSSYVHYAPSFGRGPFGHYICTSVNDAVLHGRPRDYTLIDGDLLTLDLAVATDGVVADSAVSFLVGDSRPTERLRPGLLLALEPWVMSDTAQLVSDADGWTLRSATGARTAHSEHTIAITEDGAEILTLATRPSA